MAFLWKLKGKEDSKIKSINLKNVCFLNVVSGASGASYTQPTNTSDSTAPSIGRKWVGKGTKKSTIFRLIRLDEL